MEKKISQLTAKGANLASTDLLEISEVTADGYASKYVTGAEIIAAAQTGMQSQLISGTNIKTLEGQSLLGSGNIDLTKSDVGLSNVDNTSDLSKPISTATQTALNAKQDTLVSGTNIKTVNGNSLLGSGDLVIGGGGLTIGTTAITSGTIGRILFEGTGNVVQESANLFWDNTNGRLGIGTASPNMSLDVRTGNVGIGVTSNAGYKLDVNGTARVSGDLTTSAFATSSNYLGIYSGTSGGIYGLTQNATIFIWNRRNISSGNGISIDDFNTTGGTNTNLTVVNIGGSFASTGTCVHNNLSITRAINLSSGTQTVRGIFYNPTLTNTTGLTTHRAIETVTGDVIFGSTSGSVGIGVNTSINASAILDITSTTKGFLPPRMTTTQRNAIASPASGLIVYDTTDNKHYGYNGTAWTAFY